MDVHLPLEADQTEPLMILPIAPIVICSCGKGRKTEIKAGVDALRIEKKAIRIR